MSYERVYFFCTLLLEQVSCGAEGTTCVSHVVYEHARFVLHISYECHAGNFVRLLPLFVAERKAHVLMTVLPEVLLERDSSFHATSIRTDNNDLIFVLDSFKEVRQSREPALEIVEHNSTRNEALGLK